MKSASMRRIGNFRKLLSGLHEKGMDSYTIANYLHMSHTAARTYIQQLLDAGVVVSVRTSATKPQLRLCADPRPVAFFLAELDAMEEDLLDAGACRTALGGSRFIHLLADDVNHTVPSRRVHAQRDPLVAALFGPA